MPGFHLYLSKLAKADLDALTARWGMERSATIAEALRRAADPDVLLWVKGESLGEVGSGD